MKHLTVIGVYLLLLLCIVVGFSLGRCTAGGGGVDVIEKVDTIETHDTLWQTKTDTLPVVHNEVVTHYIKVPVPTPQDSTSNTSRDSISLEVVQRQYSDDSTYTAWVSGVRLGDLPSLDSVSVRQRTIINEREITKTVTRKQPLTFGIQAGAGYGLLHKSGDIFIGVGVQWNF